MIFHVLTSRRENTKPVFGKRIHHILVPALNAVSLICLCQLVSFRQRGDPFGGPIWSLFHIQSLQSPENGSILSQNLHNTTS